MRNRLMIAAVMAVFSTPVHSKEKPLPDGISVVPEAQIAACTFVDIVTAMRFAMTSASKTQRAALIAALEKAKEKGANAAVMTSMTVQNNQHQVTLTAYKCPTNGGS